MGSYCNYSERKLDLRGVRRYREHREKNKKVGERGRSIREPLTHDSGACIGPPE